MDTESLKNLINKSISLFEDGMDLDDCVYHWGWSRLDTAAIQIAFKMFEGEIENNLDFLNEENKVVGYRFGQIDAEDVSYNFASNESELGISIAYLEGQESTTQAIRSQREYGNRGLYRCTGWVIPTRGSDGEALMWVEEVEEV